MRAITFYCDLCGDHVPNEDSLSSAVVEMNYGSENMVRHSMGGEVCYLCAKAIERHILSVLTTKDILAMRKNP